MCETASAEFLIDLANPKPQGQVVVHPRFVRKDLHAVDRERFRQFVHDQAVGLRRFILSTDMQQSFRAVTPLELPTGPSRLVGRS